MTTPATVAALSVGEWMRLFAVCFARSRPDMSAEQVVATAISEFGASCTLSPEEAAARRCNAGRFGEVPPRSARHP